MLKQTVINDIDQQIAELERIKKDLNWLPEIDFVGKYDMDIHCINIRLPYNRITMKEMENLFVGLGYSMWERSEEDSARYGEHRQSFRKKPESADGEFKFFPISIDVIYDPEITGSICKWKQIGETTRTLPIYEFACVDFDK